MCESLSVWVRMCVDVVYLHKITSKYRTNVRVQKCMNIYARYENESIFQEKQYEMRKSCVGG